MNNGLHGEFRGYGLWVIGYRRGYRLSKGLWVIEGVIGFEVIVHGCSIVDENYNPITPSITYNLKTLTIHSELSINPMLFLFV